MIWWRSIVLSLFVVGLFGTSSQCLAMDWADRRAKMILAIESDVRETSAYLGFNRFDQAVMDVIGSVPRHEFVPWSKRLSAYFNRPLPIGHGQTISQPYIVALMTHLLEPKPDHVVLEIGTGSGYQAAVLAGLVKHVYTIEIIEDLGQQAEARLARLKYANVTTKIADGYYGWSEHAPFDSIVVTAAGEQIPPPLIKQLKPGGRMVIPLGGVFQVQQLMLIEKHSDNKISTRQILPVRFVPLTGER